jgi:hypothetical protein
MPIPFPKRQVACSIDAESVKTRPATHHLNEWRCSRCNKLLGVCRDGQLHLRFARGHEYFVSLPVVATCCGCGALNRATTPER